MNPLEAPLQAVRAALAADDLDAYADACHQFNEAAAAIIRKLGNRRTRAESPGTRTVSPTSRGHS